MYKVRASREEGKLTWCRISTEAEKRDFSFIIYMAAEISNMIYEKSTAAIAMLCSNFFFLREKKKILHDTIVRVIINDCWRLLTPMYQNQYFAGIW